MIVPLILIIVGLVFGWQFVLELLAVLLVLAVLAFVGLLVLAAHDTPDDFEPPQVASKGNITIMFEE